MHLSHYHHIPIMLREAIAGLVVLPAGYYADVTFGGGEYAKAIMALLTTGHLFAFDRNPEAVKAATPLAGSSFTFIRAPFRFTKQFLHFYGVATLDGLIADLGRSSYQINALERDVLPRSDGNPNRSNELYALSSLLQQSVDLIKPQGRIVLINYHAFEDRLIKNFLNTGNISGKMERDSYGNPLRPFVPLQKRIIAPYQEEIKKNQYAGRARLRVGIRLP